VSGKIIAWWAAGVLVIPLGIAAPLIGLKLFRMKPAERRANQPVATNSAGLPTP
jgi:hypothetical protein